MPAVIFEARYAPMLLARWSNDLPAGKAPALREVIRAVGKGFVLACVIAAALALVAPAAVQLLLGHGRMSDTDVTAVANLLRLLSIGFVATMGALLLERLYLAHARNRRLVLLAVMRLVVRLAAVITALSSLGLSAFAIGYAVAEWAYLVGLILYVPRMREAR